MAGIVLKDGSGNAVEYSGVTQIKVPYQDDDGNVSVRKFTRLATINAYVLVQCGDSNGVALYEILDKLAYIPSDDFFFFGFSDEDYQNYGSDGVTCIITAKSLTVGNTYLATDLY